jgi:hypothetical protein
VQATLKFETRLVYLTKRTKKNPPFDGSGGLRFFIWSVLKRRSLAFVIAAAERRIKECIR